MQKIEQILRAILERRSKIITQTDRQTDRWNDGLTDRGRCMSKNTKKSPKSRATLGGLVAFIKESGSETQYFYGSPIS